MRSVLNYLLFALAAGCGPGVSSHPGEPPDAAPAEDAPPPIDAAPDAPPGPPPETRLLGMNDVSIFLPLPMILELPVIGKLNGVATAGDLVPRALFTRLLTAHQDLLNDFEEFHIIAIRFDVCDRIAPGPCPVDADGSLRLVLQPVQTTAGAADVGLHAFYTIPAAELPAVVNELRRIARSSNIEPTNPLIRRPLNLDAIQGFRALVKTYARPAGLIRLSVMGQDARTSELRTVFRGVEIKDGEMVDIPVATVNATQQDVALADVDPSYVVTPVSDSPTNFALTLTSGAFNAAAPADQRSALEALVATQNPQLHTSSTAQCIACHTSTYLGVHRGAAAGIDLRTLTNRYASTRDARVVEGIATTGERSLHAFSWIAQNVAISQRVVNETANALDEFEQRFPVPAQ